MRTALSLVEGPAFTGDAVVLGLVGWRVGTGAAAAFLGAVGCTTGSAREAGGAPLE